MTGGSPASHRPPFGAYLLRHTPAILVLLLLTQALEAAGCFVSGHTTVLDVLLVTRAPRQASSVAIATIGPEHRNLFGDGPRLNPGVLQKLIQGVLNAQPLVVAVDIDTAPDVYRELQSLDQYRLVWASEALDGTDGALVAGGVLGSAEPPSPNGRRVTTGLTSFRLDNDGLIRRYDRVVEVGHERQPTLAWAIVKRARAIRAHSGREDVAHDAAGELHPIWLNLAGDRYQFLRVPAPVILSNSERTWWQHNSPLKDRVVIIGGSYDKADRHATPIGVMPGVELVARAVESELGESGVHELSHAWLIALDLVVAYAFVALNWLYPAGSYWSLLRNGAAIVVLVLAASYIAFRAFVYWMNFIPMTAGVWLHLIHHRHEHTRDELAEARMEVRRLQAERAGASRAAGDSRVNPAAP